MQRLPPIDMSRTQRPRFLKAVPKAAILAIKTVCIAGFRKQWRGVQKQSAHGGIAVPLAVPYAGVRAPARAAVAGKIGAALLE